MTSGQDIDLRALVRDAVARHLGHGSVPDAEHEGPPPSPGAAATHPSHGIYLTLINAGDACVIEPGVGCTHCEYCRSHGH